MPLFGNQFVLNRQTAERRWRKNHFGFGWPKFDWKLADWSQTDAQIAKRFRLHRNSVNKIRKLHGLRQPINAITAVNGKRTNWTRELRRRSEWDWSRTNRELAYEHGVWLASVAKTRQRLRRLGFKVESLFQRAYSHKTCPIRTRRWGSVNWSLPYKNIAKKLGCSERTVRRARKLFT